MRVGHLYIVGFGKGPNNIDDETTLVAKGLFDKYSPRCGTTKVFMQGSTVATHEGTGPTNVTFRNEVGLYLLFHSFGGMFMEGHSAEYIYQFLKTIMPAEHLAAIGKVALLVCDAVDQAEPGRIDGIQTTALPPAPETPFDEGQTRSVLLHLLMNFAGHGIYPKIAGWDGYISTAPYVPKNRSVYMTTASNQKAQGNLAALPLAGKKIGEVTKHRDQSKYGFIDDAYRQQMKRVYYIENGIIHTNGLVGWSDKT
jgi:hypothetical protein